MNEITKYHNDLNTVPMRTWTAEEQDFFFSLLTQIRDKGTETVRFDKRELAELADYSIEHNERFKNTITRLAKRTNSMYYEEYKSSNGRSSYELLPLFQRFYADWADDLSDMFIEVRVTDEFEYILNKLNIEFTGFKIEEFLQIKSTYAKVAYRALKQWKTVGKKEYSIDEFKRIYEVPKSYSAGDINKRIIKPIKKELSPIFNNLKVKVLKANTRGNPVTGYLFTWKPEKTGKWEENKYSKKKKENLPNWTSNENDNNTSDSNINERLENLKKLKENKK